jgi:D-3-phosphoglycerate dehydrogenase / 2-oxoglutarate reductase
MTRVLVTCPPMLGMIDEFRPRFAEKGVELTAAKTVQVLSESELLDMVPEHDGWIAGDDPANDTVLTAGVAGKLRALVKWGVGIDNVDFAAARRLNLLTAHTPQVFGHEVADVAMTYVLGLARQTFRIDREIRTQNGWPKPSGISLPGRTVALVGFGDIGKQTARRLLSCDLKIIAYDPFFKADPLIPVESAVWPNRLEEADFVVFTCPLTPDTQHLFNEETLPHLKQGVRIVNVGRGPVIKETALLKGLNSGLIHSVGLDVFEVEPLAVDHPLRGFDNNIFGSHNGSNSSDAVRRVTHVAIDKMFDFLGV